MSETRSFAQLLAAPLRSGVYVPAEERGEGIKMVNMGELFAHGRIDSRLPMDRVAVAEQELEKSSLEAEDLLFGRRSLVAEGAGRCSLVLDTEEPATFESSIIRARLDRSRANPHFYYYLFNSLYGSA